MNISKKVFYPSAILVAIVLFLGGIKTGTSLPYDPCVETIGSATIVTATRAATGEVNLDLLIKGSDTVQHAVIASSTSEEIRGKFVSGKILKQCYIVE